MRPTSAKPRPRTSQNESRVFVLMRLVFAVALLALVAPAAHAIPITEYQKQIRQALKALETLTQIDETEDTAAYDQRSLETINGLRNLIPATQTVEWSGESFKADNGWLHHDLTQYGRVAKQERAELLGRITERLWALEERVIELQKSGAGTNPTKAEARGKLAEILQRPEYSHQAKEESAASRLVKRFLEWLRNLLPKPKPFSPGGAAWLSKIALALVILLALAVIIYVLKLFLPRMLRDGRPNKKAKKQARIVLGEKLEPDQSATDLLSEAETLARRGELRAAIRKAYIALLVELGDRKIISLAQHKTNRDYLRALREIQPLYGDVKQLTDSFEQHWYGLAHATESDWMAFRAAYQHALRR